MKAVTPASKSIFKCGVINGYLKNITATTVCFLRIGRIFLTFFRLLGRIICFEVMIFLGGGFPSDQILPVVTYAPYNIDIDKPEDLSCTGILGG